MVSKGVQYYTFMSGTQFLVKFGAPGYSGLQNTFSDNYVQNGLQIDSANMSGFTGDFAWEALLNNGPIGAGNELISSLTGNIEGGTMGYMMNTPSTVAPNFALSYGFYDSGSADGTPLTNQDQFYCYLSDNYSNWMGDLAAAFSTTVNGSTLNQFALPGAHDSGMCTMSTSLDILASPYGAALISSLMIVPGVGEAVSVIAASQAPFAIQNLAITQKDSITTMLNLGIRYFDFRPGTLYGPLAGYSPGVRYHEHAVIPGYPYIQFLEDVLNWLAAHPGEIVVVSANVQGMDGPLPSPSDLTNDLAAAFKNVNLTPEINIGNWTFLTQTYKELIASNTRLIFLNQIVNNSSDPFYAPKNDSYFASGANYNSTGYAGIITAFQNTPASGNGVYTVLQMQGTATGASWTVIATAIATTSHAYSPLMSTKPNNDTQTNQWLQKNVANNFAKDQLIVFLNDFADNCMTSTAIVCTKQRMGILPS